MNWPTKPYCDNDGKRLVVGWLYAGYNPGAYVVVKPGKVRSVVAKILSGRGVPVRKPRPMTIHNAWLRQSTKQVGDLNINVGYLWSKQFIDRLQEE
jgi:hypothetical protein